MTAPVARSPIAPAAPVELVDGWEISGRRSTAALQLCDLTCLAKVFVKADANGAFTRSHPVPFGTARRTDADLLEIGSDPGGWLTLGPIGAAAELIATREAELAHAGELISVIDLTHGRALVRLTGPDAPHVLAKVCAIDLADHVTPDLQAFRSSVAKVVTDVVRDDRPDGRRSYLLHCERSSGQFLFDSLVDAGSQFDLDVSGPEHRSTGPSIVP